MESYFKSTTITNKKVWEMIVSKLKKENSLWDHTGQQCEDKFKDLRKHYAKARDQNKKGSGLPIVTCKFYNEMYDALGDKPALKPVSIASTLKKRNQLCTQDSSSAASVLVGSSSEGDSERAL
ncbi:nucleoside diphosphate kinase 6 [Lasius niger]|uniref:Nucleoside diphosphate kinase 6 n=1 Tax=Lasius niger TaxID=67767 RepID=A0A0J7K2Q4_LASNI|nr:nucleoside diphosphate kinase 6 [Lasius niger]